MANEGAIALEQPVYPYPYAIEHSSSVIEQVRAKIAPFRFRLAAQAITKELKINPQNKVLEIGSGLGLLGKEIRKLVHPEVKYTGIDIVFNSAKKSKDAFSPVQADATNLPFPDKCFDFVISTDVFEHLADPQKATVEIFRVLKPGGKAFLVIADPSEPRFFRVVDHKRRSNKISDIDWWEELFLACGFTISSASKQFRQKDLRRIFNLPLLVKLKNKQLFACAFNPVCRPGVYILEKP